MSAKEKEHLKDKYEEAKKRRSEAMTKILPKTPFIDYIVKKNPERKLQLRTLRKHLDHFWKTPSFVMPQQTDWPIPGKIAPYD
jgi:hypothetical protein